VQSKSVRSSNVHENFDTKTDVMSPRCVSGRVPPATGTDSHIGVVSSGFVADLSKNEQLSTADTTSERGRDIRTSIRIDDVVFQNDPAKDKDVIGSILRSLDGSEISEVVDVTERSRRNDGEEKVVNTTFSGDEKNLGKGKDLSAVLENDQGATVDGNLSDDKDLTSVLAGVEAARSNDEHVKSEAAKQNGQTAELSYLLLEPPADECRVR